MSGIAGIIHFDGRPVEPGQVEAMTAAMPYRGPDGIKHWRRGNVALGQCMLRTTPESLEETQPLSNEDESLVLVMDGRVDNWEELRRELLGKGALLRTRADAELVLRAYEVWGRECLSHIDGDFAVAIWDARRQEAFCARDRFGQKPIYYTRQGQQFVFASDLHAVLAAANSPIKVNEGMLAEHLCVYVNSLDETLVEGVMRLPPACYLVGVAGRYEIVTYWSIECHKEIRYKSELEYVEHFLNLFQETVRRQTRSSTTVGIYLSGGLDSSSVLSIAAKPFGALANLDSYSLTFAGTPQCDESDYIRDANRLAGMDGNPIPYTSTPIDHYVERIATFKDVGESPNGAMLSLIRANSCGSGVRVMLAGHGADEWFDRNPYYLAQLLQRMDTSELIRRIALARRQGASLPDLWQSFLYQAVSPLIPEPLHRPIRQLRKWTALKPRGATDPVSQLVHPDFVSKVSLGDRLNAPDNCSPGVTLAHRHVHKRLNAGPLVKGNETDNREASLFQLEERYPFYSRQIVEFAFSLPESMRSRGLGKHVMREAMRDLLPESIRTRDDKGDFSHVIAETLLAPSMSEWLTCRHLDNAGYVDATHVQHQYTLFKQLYSQGSPAYMDLSWKIWAAFTLEVWLSVVT